MTQWQRQWCSDFYAFLASIYPPSPLPRERSLVRSYYVFNKMELLYVTLERLPGLDDLSCFYNQMVDSYNEMVEELNK